MQTATLHERHNENVRSDWRNRVHCKMQTAAVETDQWWLVDCVEAIYDAMFEMADMKAIYATTVPFVEVFEDGRCLLTVGDGSHLMSIKNMGNNFSRTIIAGGEARDPLFTVEMIPGDTTDTMAFLASSYKGGINARLGELMVDWAANHDTEYLSDVVFGVIGALSYLHHDEYYCATDLDKLDTTQDTLVLDLHHPGSRARVSIYMANIEAARLRGVAAFEEAEQDEAA